jgi:hypothetical protein
MMPSLDSRSAAWDGGDEIAASVLWLCGPGASLVVGVALPVDGGDTARWTGRPTPRLLLLPGIGSARSCLKATADLSLRPRWRLWSNWQGLSDEVALG